MNNFEFYIVYVTVPSLSEAEKISQTLLNKKLVACANILPNVTSHYWWHEKIESDTELLIIFKTIKEKITAVIEEVKKLHPYDVPEIIAMPIIYGNEQYLSWIKESTR